MKNIVITLFGLAILFSCTKENQFSPSSKDKASFEQNLPAINPDSIMNGVELERARPCPYATGMSILTYGQNLVVPNLYSITIGGSIVNAPLNAVIDISYRVSTDLLHWSQPTLVYCRTITPADTGLSTMVGFSHQILYLQPGEWVIYRPVIYVGGCSNPVLGEVRLVHALRMR